MIGSFNSVSRGFPFFEVFGEVEPELVGHTEAHEEDAEVGEKPTGVADDLQDGGGFVGGKGGLVEGESFVAQGVVHVDEGLLFFGGVGMVGDDFAGEVEGDFGAGVFVVGEVEEFDFEGVVVALKAEGDFVFALIGLDGLCGEAVVNDVGEEPDPEGCIAFEDFDVGGGGIDGFFGIVGCFGDGGHAHFGGDSTVGGVAGTLGLHELGVGVEMQDAGAESGVGDIEGTSGFEVLRGDGMDTVEFGIGAVDENELIGADGLGITGAPTFGDGHLAFDGEEVGEEFADDEEHEP